MPGWCSSRVARIGCGRSPTSSVARQWWAVDVTARRDGGLSAAPHPRGAEVAAPGRARATRRRGRPETIPRRCPVPRRVAGRRRASSWATAVALTVVGDTRKAQQSVRADWRRALAAPGRPASSATDEAARMPALSRATRRPLSDRCPRRAAVAPASRQCVLRRWCNYSSAAPATYATTSLDGRSAGSLLPGSTDPAPVDRRLHRLARPRHSHGLPGTTDRQMTTGLLWRARCGGTRTPGRWAARAGRRAICTRSMSTAAGGGDWNLDRSARHAGSSRSSLGARDDRPSTSATRRSMVEARAVPLATRGVSA